MKCDRVTDGRDDVLVAQLTGRMHFGVAHGLQRNGRLQGLVTDFFVPRPFWPIARKHPTLRRYCIDLPAGKVGGNPLDGLLYRNEMKGRRFFDPDVHGRAARRLAKHALRRVKKGSVSTVYSFDTNALELFESLSGRGIRLVLEQCVASRQEQISLHHKFKTAYGPEEFERRLNYLTKNAQREKREWELADAIVCPSDYVKQTLASSGVCPGKVHVLPYGFTPRSLINEPAERKSLDAPLRLMLAGTVDRRKGIDVLIRAIESLDTPVELGVFGKIVAPEIAELSSSSVRFHGKVDFDELCRAYKNADVFVLPSFLEGSATVTYEAMSFGLPLIVTYETGSVARDGVEGFVVPSGDANALAQRINELANDRERLLRMGRAAKERAASFTIEAYGDRLSELV